MIFQKNNISEDNCKSFSKKFICRYQILNCYAIPVSSLCLSFFNCKVKSLKWMIKENFQLSKSMFPDPFPSQTLSPVKNKRVSTIQNSKMYVFKNEQRKLLSSFSLPPSFHFPSFHPLWLKKMHLKNFMHYGFYEG